MRRSHKEGPGRRQGGCLATSMGGCLETVTRRGPCVEVTRRGPAEGREDATNNNLGGSHGKCKFVSGNRKDEAGECHT